VNVFNLLNVFFREDEREKVSSSATKLYFFLIYEANRSYWEGPLLLSVRRLSSLLSLSKNTVSKSLRELEDRGLIICYPRKRNSLTANKENSLTANEEDGFTANKEGGLTADVDDSLTANKKDGFTANKDGGLMANKENSLTANEGDSLTANKGDGLTADVEGKGVSSSAFWFADLELSETASRQTRMTASRQTRMTALKQMRMEKKEVYDKGGSKYAKFF